MNKVLGLVSLLILVLVTGCAVKGLAGGPTPDASRADSPTISSPEPNPNIPTYTLTVFAAASLTGAFQEVGNNFEAANPGVKVSFNFGGSQILSTQLEQGAQADVFASADQKNMSLLMTDQLVQEKSVQEFATNALIVILPPGNPGGIYTLDDLARPKLKLVLADTSVPAGNYARQVLVKLSKDSRYSPDFSTRVLANVVSNETDVKQVVAKVELGEADAGIVYVSDAVAAPKLISLTIPAIFNVVASYPIAPLANAPEPALAARFIEYVISPAGQAILAKWGFNPVEP